MPAANRDDFLALSFVAYGIDFNTFNGEARHDGQRVLSSVLGIVPSDAEWLKLRLLEAALVGIANEGDRDDYGTRYMYHRG